MGKAELKVQINAEVLHDAAAAGVDLAAAAEAGLQQALSLVGDPEARARRWAEDNSEAIRRHNQRVAERGVFGSDLRRW